MLNMIQGRAAIRYRLWVNSACSYVKTGMLTDPWVPTLTAKAPTTAPHTLEIRRVFLRCIPRNYQTTIHVQATSRKPHCLSRLSRPALTLRRDRCNEARREP